MSNLLQIRTNSFVKLAESSGATFTDLEMNQFINREYEYLQTVIVSVNEDFFAKSATFNSSTSETYQFPQDMLKLLLLEELRDSRWVQLILIPIYKKEAFKNNLYFSFLDGISGSRYYIKGDCFGIVPTKTAAGVNDLRITYVPILPVLVEDDDNPSISSVYHELLEIGATCRARAAIKEPPIDEAKYEKMLNSLVNTIQPRVKAAPQQIRMMRGLY
jgi:hypothetical protein